MNALISSIKDHRYFLKDLWMNCQVDRGARVKPANPRAGIGTSFILSLMQYVHLEVIKTFLLRSLPRKGYMYVLCRNNILW